jgi:PAS domain S-box-containing protein
MIRASTLLHILVIILAISAAALIGYINALSPAPNAGILYGVVLGLCIGILLIGGQIRAVRIKESSNTVKDQLTIAEARFQAFFNDPSVGIGILGLDRKLVDANGAFCRIFGMTHDEMIGLNSAEVTYPDDDPVSAKLFAELVVKQRVSYETERRYIRKNGEVFWAHVTMTIVCGADNQPLYLVGMLLDIDKQKRGALALAESEARFRAIFNDSAVGVGIVGLDRKVVDANPAICRMFGMTREELIGFDPTFATHPEDDPASIQLSNELASGKRDSYEVDRRYIRKNGEVFWAHISMSLVRGENDQPLYLIGILMDIDKQKRDALALEESEARFRAAFESSAIGMALTTLDGNFLKTNAAIRKMSGYTEVELENHNELEFSFRDDVDVGREFSNEMVSGKRDYYQVERRFIRKNGEVFWARLTLSAVRDAQGCLTYFVALVEDIDEQKRTLTELKKSEARFQAIFENIAVGIAILSLDGKVLAINPVTEEIVGYSESELRKMDPLELMFEEDRFIDTKKYEELVSGQRNSFVSELRYYHQDGSLYWVRVNYSLVRDLDGKPDYLIALVENIDQEKRSAEKLAAQEAEHRSMLEQRIAERTEELKQVNLLLQQKTAQDAVNNERTRLARDLHDAVTQTLFSASLIADVLPTIWDINQAEALKRLEELRQLTRGALAEMRMLLVELRPNSLTEIPLPDLIRHLCESVIGRDRLPIHINLEGYRKLPSAVQIGLYRIAQEALNNIVKHAKATQVIVTLRMGEQVRLVIEDNGSGFDTSAMLPDHFGLHIMRERADSIGAQVSIYSELNEGTQISVTWEENET